VLHVTVAPDEVTEDALTELTRGVSDERFPLLAAYTSATSAAESARP
jgi:hypothetical protein